MEQPKALIPDCLSWRNHGTLYSKEQRRAMRLGCNRWKCSRCGPRKASRTQTRLNAVRWTKLITITMPPGRGWAKAANIRYQAAHLRSFWTALKRRYGHFRYAWVREIGKPRPDCVCHTTERELAGEAAPALDCICGAGGSRLHLHVLLDIEPWIDPRWLKAMTARCGFGWIDVRAVRGSVVSYVAKYLAKGWEMPFPPNTRRCQMRGVAKLEPVAGWEFSPREMQFLVPEIFDGVFCPPDVAFWHDSG